MDFTHIFQPIQIGPLTAKNRVEVSPAEPFLCTKDGMVTDAFVAFTASMGWPMKMGVKTRFQRTIIAVMERVPTISERTAPFRV